MLCHIAIILLVTSTVTCGDSILVRSDSAMDWGDWGPLEKCPPGSFVKAISVKIEPNQGPRGDDTAMNAVRLYCVPLEHQVTGDIFDISKVMTSSQGPWGEFKKVDFCMRGVAIGFRIRVEENRDKGDDTATNDMTLICVNNRGISTTTARGMNWGSWSDEKRCPPHMGICGLETQIEARQGNGDDTALNNVAVLCCDLPNPAEICEPSDDWYVILRRDNSNGMTPMKFVLREKVGVQRSNGSSKSTSASQELYMNLGYGMTSSYLVLATNFELKLGYSVKTDHSWSRTQTSVFSSEREETMELFVPAKCVTTLYQVVGKCGMFIVNTNNVKRVDECSDGPPATSTCNSLGNLFGQPHALHHSSHMTASTAKFKIVNCNHNISFVVFLT